MELQYRTIADEYPKGKPSVFFICHPDDFERLFPQISKGILRRRNAAIWYKSNPAGYYEAEADKELALGQMRLFVISVTTRLLTQPNSAMDEEFAFAEEHHSPVLALMMEDGLEDIL